MSLRLLHVDSARSWRGGQNQVLLTLRGLAERGHEVSLACARGGVLAARAREEGLAPRELRFSGDLSPVAVLGLLRVMQQTRPQIVHAHDPHALSTALLAAWLGARPPVVATRRVDFALRGALSRAKYARSARVIAVSQAIRRVLEGQGIAGGSLRVVYEGVGDRPPAPGGPARLRELGIPAGAAVVGNVAALVGHKDQATLVAAAARLRGQRPEVHVLFLGEGEERGALEAQARALGVEDRCHFAGFRTDLDALVPAFDVFCLSSRLEGLGTSLLDAMCFARPVVATAAGGIPEAVEDGVTGRLVPPADPAALAAALAEVLGDPARAAALGAAGRRRFLERFTAPRMVEGTLTVYGEIS